MNLILARLFAAAVGAIHVVVLGALAALAVAAVLGLEIATTLQTSVSQIPDNVPLVAVIAAVFVAYVLFMGLVSTLIAINVNLERLLKRVDPSLSPHP